MSSTFTVNTSSTANSSTWNNVAVPFTSFEFTLVLAKGEDGWFVGTRPQVKGALSQGKTIKSARRNLLKAIELVEEVEAEDARKKTKRKGGKKSRSAF